MKKKTSPFTWVDWSLSATILVSSILLLVMIAPPAIEWWQNRPRPGVQVRQQYLLKQEDKEDTITNRVNYLLYLPPEYDKYHKWPLVVYLHGAGSRGHDLEMVRRECLAGQIAQGKRFDFVVISPQCPPDTKWSPELVVGLTEYICKSYSVDRDRVYLTGYSMGGFGTWRTAIHDPGRFAAIAPLAGGGKPEQAERLKDMPIWTFHGDKDSVVPIEKNQQMVDAVEKCGGHVKFTIYPGAGHGISEMTYKNKQFFDWLLSQRRF